MRKTVRVPASSANLGPGFDTLGLALDVYLECEFASAGALQIEVAGCETGGISTDHSNLIWKTMAAYGAPPVALKIHNDIPLGKGLGSSAAAIVAGLAIANELAELLWSRARILDEAARLEGHPDNAAACVLGGITVSATAEDGGVHALRMALPEGVEMAVVVPGFALATSKARAVLPECYSRADAVYNLQRVALMVAALGQGSAAHFAAALGDRIHQPYRAPLVPGLSEILALRMPGLHGCVLSGAGPAVLVFFAAGQRACCQQVVEAFGAHGQAARVVPAGIAHEGFTISI